MDIGALLFLFFLINDAFKIVVLHRKLPESNALQSGKLGSIGLWQ